MSLTKVSKLYHGSIDKSVSSSVISWNKLQLGRYIRAVTGHNNLLYHLHNIDNSISPICLDAREEFHHLANDCPALWLERQTINAQNQEHCTPETWTPLQVVNFTYFPKINEAFAKPLYVMENLSEHPTQSSQHTDEIEMHSDTDTDNSVMDVSSLSDSSTNEDSPNTDISIDTE